MNTLTDIELLILTRVADNTSNSALRIVVNTDDHDEIISSEYIDTCVLYMKLNAMLLERGIDYDTGIQTTTITTKLKIEGIIE
jgi:hypothetical protein